MEPRSYLSHPRVPTSRPPDRPPFSSEAALANQISRRRGAFRDIALKTNARRLDEAQERRLGRERVIGEPVKEEFKGGEENGNPGVEDARLGARMSPRTLIFFCPC